MTRSLKPSQRPPENPGAQSPPPPPHSQVLRLGVKFPWVPVANTVSEK